MTYLWAKLAIFLTAGETQAMLVLWTVNMVLGNYRACREGRWKWQEALEGLQQLVLCLVGMWVAWFIKNTPGIEYLGGIVSASGSEGLTLGGLVLSIYRHLSLLAGRPPEERVITADPVPKLAPDELLAIARHLADVILAEKSRQTPPPAAGAAPEQPVLESTVLPPGSLSGKTRTGPPTQ